MDSTLSWTERLVRGIVREEGGLGVRPCECGHSAPLSFCLQHRPPPPISGRLLVVDVNYFPSMVGMPTNALTDVVRAAVRARQGG